MRNAVWIIIFLAILPAKALCLPIEVYFNYEFITAKKGEIFTIDLKADIPDSVLGWGLDIYYDINIITPVDQIFDSKWNNIFYEKIDDGERLSLVTTAFPPVAGENILLSTLSFQYLRPENTVISVTYRDDKKENGFPLMVPETFADANFRSVAVNPVPEPGTFLLVGVGLATLRQIRQRSKNK